MSVASSRADEKVINFLVAGSIESKLGFNLLYLRVILLWSYYLIAVAALLALFF